MKKFWLAILAFVYISSSTGASIHMHYCMGKLADWGIGHNDSKTCGKCGMQKVDEKDNGCCKDEHRFVKNNTDQKTAEAGFQLILWQLEALPVSFIEIPSPCFSSITEPKLVSHSPPRTHAVPVYILNRNFRI